VWLGAETLHTNMMYWGVMDRLTDQSSLLLRWRNVSNGEHHADRIQNVLLNALALDMSAFGSLVHSRVNVSPARQRTSSALV
jgi:hypothetical protein